MNPNQLTPEEVFPAAIRLIHRELMPTATPQRQRTLAKVARMLSQAQREITGRMHREGRLPGLYMGITPPKEAEDLRAWGQQLRLRREEAELTRKQLANLAGVADSTIRNLETGRHKPTRAIVMRLQAVPALGLPAPLESGPFPAAGSSEPWPTSGGAEFSCNCWFAPEYDSIKIARDLVQKFNGVGGHIEQTFLYTDHASAAAWCAITAQEGYIQAMSTLPIPDLAKEATPQIGNLPVDVIGLGAGEAKSEVRFVQALFSEGHKDIRLFLLDISQPLLSAGYRNAANSLADIPGIGVFAIQGNFHNLPTYTPLFEPVHRRRIACMFGETLSNLENELLLLRNSLSCLAIGDLLVVSVPFAVAPADRPDEIMQKDPRLSGTLPESSRAFQGRMNEFFAGPFKRYVRGLHSVTLSCVLDLEACPVPGSYAVDWRACVKTETGRERTFSLGGLSKRYDPVKFIEFMKRHHWELVNQWRYAEEHHPRILFLYRKIA